MRAALRRHVRYLPVGMILEVAAFYGATPARSDQPATPLEQFLGVLQFPGLGLFGVIFGTGLGRALDSLPHLPAKVIFYAGILVAFLVQSALMTLPVYLVARIWNGFRKD